MTSLLVGCLETAVIYLVLHMTRPTVAVQGRCVDLRNHMAIAS